MVFNAPRGVNLADCGAQKLYGDSRWSFPRRKHFATGSRRYSKTVNEFNQAAHMAND